MDGHRFDELTRTLAQGTSRRRVLAGGLAALAGAVFGRGAASAAPGSGGGKPQGRCPDGYTNCRGTCVDITDNPEHCGACYLQCSPGEVCVAGVCEPEAPAGACPVASTCPDGEPVLQTCDDPNCYCLATVEGETACIAPIETSTSCTTTAACGPGAVCAISPCSPEFGAHCFVQSTCSAACGATSQTCTAEGGAQGSCCDGLVCDPDSQTCAACSQEGSACFGAFDPQGSCCAGLVCQYDETTGTSSCIAPG